MLKSSSHLASGKGLHRLYSTSTNPYDIAIIGGGIVGLSTARELLIRHPKLSVVVLEKEKSVATHQSQRNSGVIHAGMYYKPGSERARLCVKGNAMMYDYCKANKIPHRRVGKLIVAVNEKELPSLRDIYERGVINKVPGLEMLTSKQIPEVEPNIRGLAAVLSPSTGITSFHEVALSMSRYIQACTDRAAVITNYEVVQVKELPDNTKLIHSKLKRAPISARNIISCSGLYADKVATMCGGDPLPKVLPFRGTWLTMKPEFFHLIKGNIYPVPNPKFPWLGVHFTPTIDGEILLGPNAVLAASREGYSYGDIKVPELIEFLKYSGFHQIIKKHWQFGLREVYRDICTSVVVKDLQRYMPNLRAEHIEGSKSGVRAAAVDTEGNIIDDFVFETQSTPGQRKTSYLHVRNALSPAATSSLAIAQVIADKAQDAFNIHSLVEGRSVSQE